MRTENVLAFPFFIYLVRTENVLAYSFYLSRANRECISVFFYLSRANRDVLVRDLRRDLSADENTYISDSSTRNQRIESWWGYLWRHHIQFWLDSFKTLQHAGDISGSYAAKCLIQFCFMALLQVNTISSILECILWPIV